MKTSLRVVSGLILSVVFMAAIAGAEEGSMLDPFSVSLTLRADHTDNRDSAPDELKESTYDYYIKPQLNWKMDWERSSLNMFYAPSWRYRTDESRVQNDEEWQHDVGLHAEYSTSPGMVLRFDEKFDYTDDPSISEESSVVRRNTTYLLNRTEIGATRAFGEVWTGDLSAHYMTKQYDEDVVAEDSDEDRVDGQGKLLYQVSPSVSTYALVRYSDFSFDSAKDLERDFISVLTAVGLNYTVNPKLAAGFKAGVQSQDYDDPAIDVDEVPYASVWIAASTIPTTRLRLDIGHGLRDSDVYPFASQEYTEIRATVSWDVLPRVTLSAMGMYRDSDYDDAAPGAADATDFVKSSSGNEDKYIAQGEVSYKFNDRNKLSIIQRYEDVESDVAWDYTKNTTRVLYGRAF